MKRNIIILLVLTLLLGGCGKKSNNNIAEDFIKSIKSSKSYTLKGKMKIQNDEDTFNYDLDVAYLKDNYYKVILVNETNDHEQVILRNDDGVYVITPSLNKSFKFDSVWPENSSQSYLLRPIATDLENDPNKEFQQTEDGYMIKSTVNYPNNPDLKYQKIYINKDNIITKNEIYNDKDQVRIEVTFTNVDMKASVDKKEFALENFVDQESGSSCDKDTCDKKTGSMKDIIYPLYVPTNTYLSGKDEINNEDIERVILTFSGDKNFVLIEENAEAEEVFEIIPIYGDPLMINDTIGALGTNSIYWASGGKDYYLVSNDLTVDELLNVASSVNGSSSVVATK
jgi:outer membrane lipoprotein-sorting protein